MAVGHPEPLGGAEVSVSAIIVTRGNVSLRESMEALPEEWEKLVWCNGTGLYRWREDISGSAQEPATWQPSVPDRSDWTVWGRYRAIDYAANDLIYVQDDDCVVSDPYAIVHAFLIATGRDGHEPNTIVCNMPQRFRHDFYEHHGLVGFGAAFHRSTPGVAMKRWYETKKEPPGLNGEWGWISRTCDIIVTGLSPLVFVDIPYIDRPYASDPDRMWKQPTHQAERKRMLDTVLKIR